VQGLQGRGKRPQKEERNMRLSPCAVACVLGITAATAAFADAPPPHHSVCLDPYLIDNLTYPNDYTILFHMRGGPVKIWRNTLPHKCSGLSFEQGIAWTIRGDEICSNMQIFHVLRRGTPCALGDFTPYQVTPQPH
jgi:hypothetical protein